jgi:glycosyltransferase involved in cell wall biosynthesis
MAVEPYRARTRYVAHPNRGVGAALNTGVRASRGRFIAFLDADDRWAPEFLARQVSFLEANRACAVVYCDARIAGHTALAAHRFSQTPPSNDQAWSGLLSPERRPVTGRGKCALLSWL